MLLLSHRRLVKPFQKGGRTLVGLSIGFSKELTPEGLAKALTARILSEICTLGLHFCVQGVTNALLTNIGRSAPNLAAIDIRGCTGCSTLVGLMDGRAESWNERNAREKGGGQVPLKRLLVMCRYAGQGTPGVKGSGQDDGTGILSKLGGRELVDNYGIMFEVRS